MTGSLQPSVFPSVKGVSTILVISESRCLEKMGARYYPCFCVFFLPHPTPQIMRPQLPAFPWQPEKVPAGSAHKPCRIHRGGEVVGRGLPSKKGHCQQARAMCQAHTSFSRQPCEASTENQVEGSPFTCPKHPASGCRGPSPLPELPTQDAAESPPPQGCWGQCLCATLAEDGLATLSALHFGSPSLGPEARNS